MDRHSWPEPTLWVADPAAQLREGESPLTDRRQGWTVTVGLSRHCGTRPRGPEGRE